MTEPPCYVQAYRDTLGVTIEYTGWRWVVKNGPPVPAHDSDAWLAGIIKACLQRGRHLEFDEDFQGVAAIKFCVISNLEQAFAPTLHAALCRAVLPEGEHTC